MTTITLNQAVRDVYGMSPEQREILKLICIKSGCDYSSLQQDTRRERISVLQSVTGLRDNKGMIKSVRVDPKNPRSRLEFVPSLKGAAVAITYLEVPFESLTQAHGHDILADFNKYFPNAAYRKELFRAVSKYLLDYNLFSRAGDMKALAPQERLKHSMLISQIFQHEHIILSSDLAEMIESCHKAFDKSIMAYMYKQFKEADSRLHVILDTFNKLGYAD